MAADEFNLPLDPIDQLQGQVLDAASSEADQTSSIIQQQEADKKKAQKSQERLIAEGKQPKKRTKRKPINNLLGHASPIVIKRPNITTRLNPQPQTITYDQQGNTIEDNTSPVETQPQQGSSASTTNRSTALATIKKSPLDILNRVNSQPAPPKSTALSVLQTGSSLANQTNSTLTPYGGTVISPGMLGAGATGGNAGGGIASAGGGTRPWYQKMNDTLDTISEDLKRIIELLSHEKGKSVIEKNGSGSTDSKKGGGLLDGLLAMLTPLIAGFGALLAIKFGGIVANLANVLKSGVDGILKSIEGVMPELENETKGILAEIKKLIPTALGSQPAKAAETVAENAAHSASTAAKPARGAANKIKEALDKDKPKPTEHEKPTQPGEKPLKPGEKPARGAANKIKEALDKDKPKPTEHEKPTQPGEKPLKPGEKPLPGQDLHPKPTKPILHQIPTGQHPQPKPPEPPKPPEVPVEIPKKPNIVQQILDHPVTKKAQQVAQETSGKAARFGLTKGGKFTSGALGIVGGAATIVGGVEAGLDIYQGTQEWKSGDQWSGTSRFIDAAGTISQYGGPKDMIGHIPFAGKFLSKAIPNVAKPLTNKILQQVVMRGKAAVVDATAEAAIGATTTSEVGGIGAVPGLFQVL